MLKSTQRHVLSLGALSVLGFSLLGPTAMSETAISEQDVTAPISPGGDRADLQSEPEPASLSESDMQSRTQTSLDVV